MSRWDKAILWYAAILAAAILALAIVQLAAAADPWETVQFEPAAPATAQAPLQPTNEPGVYLGSDGRYWAFGTDTGTLCYWNGRGWEIWWHVKKPPAAAPPMQPPCPNGRCQFRQY